MRSRRSVFAILFGLLVSAILLRHIVVLVRILSVYVSWSSISSANTLSQHAHNFDTTFESYPLLQYSAQWPPPTSGALKPDSPLLRLANGSFATSTITTDTPDLVPAILHHIYLGRPRSEIPVSWELSRQTCLDFHPTEANYTHHFWDDESAVSFMSAHYPWFVQRWLNYKYPIQRADSLRYFVLHHYGGTFLDLDLECLRSLGPLRKYPIVNIAANPAGVSNGFMMASPQHPFLGQVISALQMYDRSWFWIPYIAVMFSTGPMFLSAEHLRFSSFTKAKEHTPTLAILGEKIHRLSGRVITPLFRHQGSSSWHNDDAKFLRHVLRAPVFVFLVLGGVILVIWATRRYSLLNAREEDAEECLPLTDWHEDYQVNLAGPETIPKTNDDRGLGW